MANQASGLICMRCRWANAPGARYCANCGEPVDPALIAELQRLYTVLTELDTRVTAGLGDATVRSLRDTIREQYLTQRTSQPQPGAPATPPEAVPAPVTVPLRQPVAPQPAPAAMAAAATTSVSASPPQPHGPVFSWRAFIAEQAIAVMAYLGGFLLLIATLTFEVGGWQALPDSAKLAGVVAVYLIFGALGIALRRSTSLRTVSRVYLGVFALMTPLAALAVYRFELQARGFSVAGMICLAAAYTAIVYLSLAARTRFVTYAYLAWAALLLSALAIPSWAQLAMSWWIPIMNLMALALLSLHFARRRAGAAAWLETLEPSATQFSAGASLVGASMTIVLSLQVAGGAFASVGIGAGDEQARAALAVAACALTLLSAAWSRAARTLAIFSHTDAVTALDWSIGATAALAAVAVAGWLHASPAGFSYTLTGVALVEGLAAEGLRARAPGRAGLRISVQILAAALVVIAATMTSQVALPNTPLLAAGAVAVTLGLLFALRGSLLGVFPWGLYAGVFLLIGAHATFAATLPSDLLHAFDDQLPQALAQQSTLQGLLALALVALGLGLRAAPMGSRPRRLRVAAEVTALLGAVYAAFLLSGHTRYYSALFLGLYALAALVVARVERQPVLAGFCAAIFGIVGSLVFIVGNLDGALVVTLPIALALLTLALALGRALGRAYSAPVYAVTLVATFAGFLQLVADSAETTAQVAPLALGVGGWMALAVALLLTVDALTTRASTGEQVASGPQTVVWMLAPAGAALLSVVDAHDLWPIVALTLVMAGMGALLRWARGVYWELAWHGAAIVASVVALSWAMRSAQDPAAKTLGLALCFALVAYLIAWQERQPWLSAAIIPYAVVALWEVDALPQNATGRLITTFIIALGFTFAGMGARLRLGRAWALAPYAVAVIAAGFTAARVSPYPERAGLLEALLLIFAALAFLAALLEETPWAAMAPAAFAAAAALAQPDGRALLPLALGLAAAAFAVSRTRGGVWAIPLYGATMVAAVAATWQGRTQSGQFEVVALLTLALAAWLLAALESRADALLVAYTFAALAVSAAARAFTWDPWQTTLAFAALAWVFDLAGEGWARIPWLREREGAWLPALGRASVEQTAAWRDPRRAGRRVARGAAALVAVGVVIGGCFAPQAFATHSPQTQALAVALLSLAALLTRFGWGDHGWRPALYLAGEALALCITWELRWLGAENIQAWIIAPGSAQLVIGALLPADTRLRPPAWVAQAFSIAGALILTLPTLGQSISEPVEWQWRYTLLLAVEALALTLLAVGLRNRILALTGSAFVGVAAIRGAIIAVQQNLPVPLVIGVFAVALMGLATWLSLRARRMPHAPTSQ